MTRVPRPTLRALRSVVARALGVRRSRVRVTETALDHPPGGSRAVSVRLVATGNDPSRDWWGVNYVPSPRGRWAVRYITRRAWSNDLP